MSTNKYFPQFEGLLDTIDLGHAKLTFSQFGEDQLVWERFQFQRNGFYNDWETYRPRLLSVEVHGLDTGNPGENPTFQFLRAQGYTFFAQYYATSFFELRG